MMIRDANSSDIETLFAIRTSVVENHQSREELADLGITPTAIAQMLQNDCHAWIAEQGTHAVGFAMANATEHMIFAMFVRPEFEGLGAGRRLMQHAEQWLQAQGAQQIWLLTGNDPSLRAYGFYLHLGWRWVGVEPDGSAKFVRDLA
ncbi:N-acetyltransferase family protein [Leptolyngbya sp. AN02str]|uniref:GNAT family N-acetyltransferase n=1 Tax=Leptolyngbya sp. AN02str TaxID=3423363 RepID=UPI003D321CBE